MLIGKWAKGKERSREEAGMEKEWEGLSYYCGQSPCVLLHKRTYTNPVQVV